MFLREVASKPCPSPLARPRARFDKGVHKNRPQGRCGKEDTRFAYSSLVFSEGAQAYFLRARRYFTRASCGFYAVQDVSIGGCSLRGGPPRQVGEQVDILLHLPHRAPLALSAQVRRRDSLSMGLKFEHTTPKAEDSIQDFVVETFASATTDNGRVALVVEPRHAERQALVRTLRELGRRAIGVATALDAVQMLVEEGAHVDTVFIEAVSESLPSLELVEFLSHNHPRIRRVLIGEQHQIAASWVAQATGEVHALLETPCDPEAVHRVLHRLQFTPNDAALS